MSTLSATCPCGHSANWHLSREQQAAYRAGTNGRFSGECKGNGNGPHCRCITDRETVIAAARIDQADEAAKGDVAP